MPAALKVPTLINAGNKVEVDIDCLDYEVLWEDMIIGEQIGQVNHLSSAKCMTKANRMSPLICI